jgi:hypothetical protein
MVFMPNFVKFCHLVYWLVMYIDVHNRHDHRTKLNRFLVWKLTVPQLVEKCLESIGSLLCSQASSLVHMTPLHALHLIS